MTHLSELHPKYAPKNRMSPPKTATTSVRFGVFKDWRNDESLPLYGDPLSPGVSFPNCWENWDETPEEPLHLEVSDHGSSPHRNWLRSSGFGFPIFLRNVHVTGNMKDQDLAEATATRFRTSNPASGISCLLEESLVFFSHPSQIQEFPIPNCPNHQPI